MIESPTSRSELAAPLAGAVALAGLAATFTAVGPVRLRFVLVGAGLFFSTGFALLRAVPALGGGKRGIEPAFAFPFAALLLFVPLFAGQLFGFGTTALHGLARPYLAVAGVSLLRHAWRGAAPSRGSILAAAVLLAVGTIAFTKGALVTLPSDAPDHIAVLREIQSTGDAFPTTSYYAESTDRGYDPRKGFLLAGAAVAADLAGAEAADAYEGLPALAAVLFTIAFYRLAREALGRGGASCIALAYALLAYDGGILGTWFGRSGSPFLFAGPLVWAALLVTLRACRHGESLLPAALVTGFSLMGAHVFAAITAFLLGGLFAAAFLLFRKKETRAGGPVIALAALLAGSLPIGLWRFVTTYPPLDPIHTHLQGIVRLGAGLYVANPVLAFGRINLLGLAGIPLSLLLLRQARREAGILFALATTLLPFLVVLNPWLVPLLVPVVGYLLGRIVWYGGHFLVVATLSARWARTLLRPGALPRRGAAFAALLLVHGLFATSLWARDAVEYGRRLTGPPKSLARAPGPEKWEDLFTFMNENLPPRAVVATDPLTGYMIPAFTEQKVIAIRAQHASPADPEAPGRIADMVRAMSPYVSGRETAAILAARGARYVLLDFRLDEAVTGYLATVDPRLYEATLRKFRGEPERYREIWAAGRCHLFAIDPAGGEGAREPVLSALLDGPPPAEARPVGVLFGNGVRLAAVAAPAAASPGETIAIACYWTKKGESDDPIPYKVYIRLTGRRPSGGGRGAKIERKWREARTGRRERARTMRNIAGGAYPPALWPREVVVADTILWRIPPDLEEGVYDLEILLRRSPFVQVLHLEDFLREKDSFSGAPAGRIAIARRATA